MKVFISWSGKTSHAVAMALRDWLPSVIQSINPYVSSEDIDKGARWSSDIAGELDESSFGILCVTADNINAPWLNFEAGALGKSVERSKVCPFLFRIKPSDIDGPMLQYQSTIYDEKDIYKLLLSINNAFNDEKIDEKRLEKIFEVWWPILDKALNEIEDIEIQSPISTETPEDEENTKYLSKVLEEVLEISRTNQRLLRDPETILPFGYFEHMINKMSPRERNRLSLDKKMNLDIHPGAIEDLVEHYRGLLKFMSRQKQSLRENEDLEEMYYLLRRMDEPLRYISKEMGLRLPRDIFDDKLL
jgi:hypothetical protein